MNQVDDYVQEAVEHKPFKLEVKMEEIAEEESMDGQLEHFMGNPIREDMPYQVPQPESLNDRFMPKPESLNERY